MNNHYQRDIPNAIDFEASRQEWRNGLGADDSLRQQAVELQQRADQYHFGYQWEWCGLPIIRCPDDIVLLQEIVWTLRPTCIIETGVARGGSVILSASLMAMCGLQPAVLGLDIAIHQHTYDAVRGSSFESGVQLVQCDSVSEEAATHVHEFLNCHQGGAAILVLDSDHTEAHVLAELQLLAPLMPKNSIVLVADTVVEEFPTDYYPNRPWARGNSPASALRKFLDKNSCYEMDQRFARRGLVTEFRDGLIVHRCGK